MGKGGRAVRAGHLAGAVARGFNQASLRIVSFVIEDELSRDLR
jgi:hypothetical protein